MAYDTSPLPQGSAFSGFGFALGIAVVIAVVVYFLLVGDTTTEEAKNEKYANFGSVGKQLVPTNAPQEYQVLEPTNISKSASSAISASSAVVLADMNTSQASIKTPSSQDMAAKEGTIMEDIKFATKGDGQIRPVDVDNNEVSQDLVKLAMFENQDFMYRLQTPINSMPHLQDPSLAPQKSMFRKMTYPLSWQGGNLGMDVIGQSDDTRVTVSFEGGKPPMN